MNRSAIQVDEAMQDAPRDMVTLVRLIDPQMGAGWWHQQVDGQVACGLILNARAGLYIDVRLVLRRDGHRPSFVGVPGDVCERCLSGGKWDSSVSDSMSSDEPPSVSHE